LKTTRQQLDIINAYQELGSYRAAAQLCGTTDKTVKRVVEREPGETGYRTRLNRVDFRRDSKVWKGGPQSPTSLGGRS
jgi:hypothetical protein